MSQQHGSKETAYDDWDNTCLSLLLEGTLSHLVIRAIALTFRSSHLNRRSRERMPETILLLIFWLCDVAIFQCDRPKLGDSKEKVALIHSSAPSAQILPLAIRIEFVQLCPSLLQTKRYRSKRWGLDIAVFSLKQRRGSFT